MKKIDILTLKLIWFIFKLIAEQRVFFVNDELVHFRILYLNS